MLLLASFLLIAYGVFKSTAEGPFSGEYEGFKQCSLFPSPDHFGVVAVRLVTILAVQSAIGAIFLNTDSDEKFTNNALNSAYVCVNILTKL